MQKILAVIAIVVAIGIGAWYFFVLAKDSSTPTETQTPSRPSTSQNTENTQPATHKITYTATGFQPRVITVKAGATLEVANESGRSLDFSSGSHPIHTDNSELNIGAMGPGETKQFTPTAQGTWSYHNHLNSTHSGEIRVE